MLNIADTDQLKNALIGPDNALPMTLAMNKTVPWTINEQFIFVNP